MKIKTQFIGVVVISAVLVLGSSWVSYIFTQRVNEAMQKNVLADSILKGVFEINVVTNDYIISRSERANSQWQIRHQSLTNIVLLADTLFLDEDGRALINHIRQNQIRSRVLFFRLTIIWGDENLQGVRSELAVPRVSAIINQINITSQSMFSDAIKLSNITHTEVNRIQNITNLIAIGFALSVFAIFILMSIWGKRRILTPISRLTESVEEVSKGNLETTFLVTGRDEFGVLGEAFNKMTEVLRANITLKRLTKDLARSNADLQQFAYVASHDLQEPLRMVSSYVQLLDQRYQDKLDTDAREFIDFAVDGANRMQILIQDLLSYSRIGTEGGELILTSLNSVLADVSTNLKVAIEEHAVGFTHDELPTVWGDKGQLARLLQNLISNAIKFRSNRTPEIHVGAERQNDEWLLSVRDNGIGIAPDYTERIFVIFQRLHKKEEYEGTGIGLAICKRIVERHGGRIWMESTPGEGSTFFFTLSTGTGRK